MRALLQRVSEASVSVAGSEVGRIGPGLLVFLGVGKSDTTEDVRRLAQKVMQLRIFNDSEGRMNRSVLDTEGQLLIISQFTLYGDTRKGNRPSYSEAALPEAAEQLYKAFVEGCRSSGLHVQTGVFRADMQVSLTNDGPVTLMCDSGQHERPTT